jgi:hypothetical protein
MSFKTVISNSMKKVLPEKLTVAQLVKKLLTLYETQIFITVFIRACPVP